MTPCLLALDTATDQLTAGLLAPGLALGRDEPGGALASARLIPLLQGLLAEAGLPFGALQAVAFGQGPGAFTGLRSACAVAQGLAWGGGLPVLAIDSLLINAEDARAQALAAGLPASGGWWVAMDARMNEAYAAHYHHDGQGWRVLQAPQLWTLPALAAAWAAQPPRQVAGNAITAFEAALPWGAATRWPVCSARAQALLRLAQAAWQRGELLAAELARPLYLRDKVALTTAERDAVRQAAAAVPP